MIVTSTLPPDLANWIIFQHFVQTVACNFCASAVLFRWSFKVLFRPAAVQNARWEISETSALLEHLSGFELLLALRLDIGGLKKCDFRLEMSVVSLFSDFSLKAWVSVSLSVCDLVLFDTCMYVFEPGKVKLRHNVKYTDRKWKKAKMKKRWTTIF